MTDGQLSLLGLNRKQLTAIASGFDPGRLTQARRLSGLRKKEIAASVGVSAVSVTHWETGSTAPRPDHLARLADLLDVPPAFFAVGRPFARLDSSDAHFRSLKRTPAHHRERALAFAEQVWELTHALENYVNLFDVDVPTISDSTPEHAAQLVRTRWGLRPGPIPHLVQKMELHGIVCTLTKVAGSATTTATVDAFSTSKFDRPIVVLTPDRADDVYRHRFTAAHELGHLVMHEDHAGDDPQKEREADRFAAELLTPAAEIVPCLPKRLDFKALLRLSEQWGTSVDSLIYRCRETGAVSESTYRRAYQRLGQLRSLGQFRAVSVESFPGEVPALLRKAMEAAEKQGVTLADLSSELVMPLPKLRALLGDVEPRPTLQLIGMESREVHCGEPPETCVAG